MGTVKRLLNYIRPYLGRMSLGAFCMVGHSIMSLLMVWLFGNFVDTLVYLLMEEGLRPLHQAAFFMFLVFVFKGIFYYGQEYLTVQAGQRAIRDLRNDTYSHVQDLSLGFYQQHNTGQIISRLTNDMNEIQQVIIKGTLGVFERALTLAGALGLLFYLHWRLALFIVLIVPPIVLLFHRFSRRIRGVSRSLQQKMADLTHVLQETISGARIVKSFAMEEEEKKRFQRENEAHYRYHMKNAQLAAMLTPLVESCTAFAFVAVLWYGGVEVIRGFLTPGELMAFFGYLLTIGSPLKSLSRLAYVIQRALAAAERVFSLQDEVVEVQDCPGARDLQAVEGHVTFEGVSFTYPQSSFALKDIDLQAPSGYVLAIVGPSGAGKSTLMDLIPRFLEPQKGRILLDGQDISRLKQASLRQHMAIVPQDTLLFSTTIEENIAYGRPGATAQAIEDAARAANAHDFIQSLPQGYKTLVGERGNRLSGGEKQRIAIARALLKDPRVLILDEATSHLDPDSESLVQEALDRLMETRTTFVIAHRLSTVRQAHEILFLKEGQVLERGSHEELLANQGLYYDFYRTQFRGHDDVRRWVL